MGGVGVGVGWGGGTMVTSAQSLFRAPAHLMRNRLRTVLAVMRRHRRTKKCPEARFLCSPPLPSGTSETWIKKSVDGFLLSTVLHSVFLHVFYAPLDDRMCVFLSFSKRNQHSTHFMVNESLRFWVASGGHSSRCCVGTICTSILTRRSCDGSSRFCGRNWTLWGNYQIGYSASKPLTACGASRAQGCAHNRSKHVSSRTQKRTYL